MSSHRNIGKCEKCTDLMNEFGVDDILRNWFVMLQAKILDVHISCAGRDEETQEDLFKKGKTRARFSQSPHNYTPALALDLFQIVEGKASFGPEWYKQIIVPEMPKSIAWGGHFKKFFDSPHFELTNWKAKAKILIWRKNGQRLA